MVNVPGRGLASGFACATNCTSDVPPLPDEEIVNQLGSLLADVQLQTPGATTPTEPAPPEAGTEPVDDWRL